MDPMDDPSLDEGEPLVTSMTRPQMLGGMTLMSIGLSIYLPGMVALILKWPWALAGVPVLLLASYLICLEDVYLFDLFLATRRLRRCRNQRLWGCRRYAPR